VHLAAKASETHIRLIGVARSSKHNVLYSAPYSYNILVDYHDPNWPGQVVAATGGAGVHYALDTISERDTVENVHSTLHPQGKYHVFRSQGGGQYETSHLKTQPIYGTVWEGLGHSIDYGNGNIT
jgi:NADPH:quinone reductase-like Zn-dependent oxidoreductase